MKKLLIIFLVFGINISMVTYGDQLKLVDGDSVLVINVAKKIRLVEDKIQVIKNPVLKKSFKVVELFLLLDVNLIDEEKIIRLISDDNFFVDLKIQSANKPFVDLDKFEKTDQVDLVYENGKRDMKWIKNIKTIEIINDTDHKILMVIPGENIYNDAYKKLSYEKSMMENLMLLHNILSKYELIWPFTHISSSLIHEESLDFLSSEIKVIYTPAIIIKRVNEINSKKHIKYIVIRLMNCDCKNYILDGKDCRKFNLYKKDEYIYTNLYEIAYIKWIKVHYLVRAHQENL